MLRINDVIVFSSLDDVTGQVVRSSIDPASGLSIPSINDQLYPPERVVLRVVPAPDLMKIHQGGSVGDPSSAAGGLRVSRVFDQTPS